MIKSAAEELRIIINRSEKWSRASGEFLHGRDLTNRDPRTWMAAALYLLSIEHQHGIHALVRDGINGSATALVRPQLEAYLRALWVRHIADNAALDSVMKKERELPGGPAIMAKLTGPHEELQRIVTPMWKDLCDYTHGGFIQITTRAHETGIAEHYRPGHIESVLTTSCTLLALAGVGMAELIGDEVIGVALWDAYLNIMKPDELVG